MKYILKFVVIFRILIFIKMSRNVFFSFFSSFSVYLSGIYNLGDSLCLCLEKAG